jgi:predicted amidohydrolase YtcJ
VELLSVAEVQDWIREKAKSVPAGTWIRVPRADITRLKERRHPTPTELDAACSTHPVIFTAARKSALNSLGLETIGVNEGALSVPSGEVILDARGKVRLIAGASSHLRKFMPRPSFPAEKVEASLRNVHRLYNSVGITSIFERAGGIGDFLLYRKLRTEKKLTVRMTQTFRSGFRSARDVAAYSEKLGMKTGDGDEWVRVGPLKITVDGGIHWGNTYLREPYGEKRIRFYVHEDPAYRGALNYTSKQMTEIFREGHRLGWQWCCHVTGDAGVDEVLDALSAVHREHPDIAARRFSFTHAYFPALDSIARAKKLGVCVDTQPSLYFKDSAAIAEFYGNDWASRFIGLGDWVRGGIPTAIAGDHMMGLDPDRSMNAYNPFLMLQVAVTRRNREGDVYGKRQRISRLDALRCLTRSPAWLSFEESAKGSLEKGKLADLVVLDRDYLTCPENEIAGIKAEQTMVDGRFVFIRGD